MSRSRTLLANESPHALQRVVMPILRRRGHHIDVVGTEFSLGRNLCLTATHTVEPDDDVDEAGVFYIHGSNDDGTNGVFLPIHEVTAHPNQTEIALLTLEMSSSTDTCSSSVRCSSPSPLRNRDPQGAVIGSPTTDVDMVGYNTASLTLIPHLNASQGEVKENDSPTSSMSSSCEREPSSSSIGAMHRVWTCPSARTTPASRWPTTTTSTSSHASSGSPQKSGAGRLLIHADGPKPGTSPYTSYPGSSRVPPMNTRVGP